MWKKFLILVFAVISTITLAYTYLNLEMNATSSVYTTKGNVNGRINKNPSNLAVINSGMRKGDKLTIGNNMIPFQLLYKLNGYTQYTVTGARKNFAFPQSEPISSWISGASVPYGDKINAFSSDSAFYLRDIMWVAGRNTNPYNLPDYTDLSYSLIYPKMQVLNQQIDTLSYKDDLIAPRDLTNIARYYLEGYSVKSEAFDQVITAQEIGQHAFLFDLYTMSRCDGACSSYIYSGLEGRDAAFSDAYWTNTFTDGPDTVHNGAYVVSADGIIRSCGQNVNAITGQLYIRPFINIDTDKIVFALSSGTSASSGLAAVTVPSLSDSYSSIYNATVEFQPMKPRLENADLTATTTLHEIQGKKGNVVTKAVKNSTVRLKASARSGSDSEGGVNTVSALVFNANKEFQYYKPLESAKGTGLYDFDLSGIPVGKYKIAIVNEIYNGASDEPTYSSAITDVLDLEIIESLTIQVTAKTGLEYQKNVNQNDVVATYTTSNGVAPITTTIISDTSVSGHENDYQYFSISNGNVIVNNPSGLEAGDYYFKLNAVDANDDPSGGVNSTTVHIVVAKTMLQIAFDVPDVTKKSMAEAASVWDETATTKPNTGTKITYSIVGGDIGLITIDKDTGKITYKGNNAFGSVTIKAIADDDPSTGFDNYDSAATEKEIVIYREVDGVVTPHSNSKDTTIPTYTMNQSNVKSGGVIATVKGTLGTPDTIKGSTTTYKYSLKDGGDGSFFTVNASSGAITTKANLAVGIYNITVTVSDKWSTKEIPVKVIVKEADAEELYFYETSAAIKMITTKSVTLTDKNVSVFATVKGSSNNNPVTYKIKDGSTNVITVNPNSGAVTIHGVGKVIIVAEKQGASGQADAQTELEFTVTAGAQNFIYTDNAGNEMPKQGTVYKALTEVYAPNKTFQLYTKGNPTGTTVTYQLKAGSPTDVISVDSNGLVTILNASLTNQMGKVIVQATSHDPSGNYDDKTIELPINIEKGTRVISFAENPIYVTSGKGKVTPVTEVGGSIDTDGDVLIEVDSNEDHTIAWTNDNKNIDYNYSGDTGKDIKIHATKPMDRNYKAAEADGIIHIMGPDENILAITSPGQIIYGDHFTIRSSQYDADSINVQYTFEVDSTTYISNPTVNGNSAEFDALKFSGTSKTTITVTRTADGEVPLSKKIQVTVLPKPIEIIIDDKEKLKGEQNPTLTYQDFRSELVSWNGVQDSIQEKDIKLSTTAKTNSNAGSYPIKGDANTLNNTYPNYKFTFKDGTLTINEDNIEDDWYHLELDDGSNTEYTGNWTNKDVNIVSDHNEYIHMSLDQSTWKQSYVTVSKEGETNQSFWMKKDSGAITKEKQELIKIDKKVPKVKNIKAKDTNNKLQDIINKLSGGVFFKPGTSFEITTDDSNADLKVSGTKEITYKVYKIETQARAGEELIKEGTLTVTNEKANITISETAGTYKVCVIPTDHAGNTNSESCHEVTLKKIDEDVDGDGKPDFNDPDGDGCPDLNIKWKDPNNESKWIVINGDRNYDGIPDLNIDSDGDGKPDLNIDTDNDGKPDLNLVVLKKSDWKPSICVKADVDNGILEEYCTGTSVKPVINVDTDGDGIPNINIDNKGDFKPHINIAKDGETPTVNLVEIHEWKPNKDYKSGKFTYDSFGKNDIKPELNIDSDGDGRPDINIDLDGDGNPDINIDLDGDGVPDIDIDSTGDGVPDVNVDTDGDGKPDENIIEITEWKPGKDIDGDLPYDTMDFNHPDDPEDPDKSDNETDDKEDKPDTSVMGQYNPETSMGGANTGDSTNLMYYMGISFLSISLLCFITYKQKTEKER